MRDFDPAYVRFGSFATGGVEAISQRMSASPPKADKPAGVPVSLLCANRRHMQCSKKQRYSITSSARPSKVGGNSRPSAFAGRHGIAIATLPKCAPLAM